MSRARILARSGRGQRATGAALALAAAIGLSACGGVAGEGVTGTPPESASAAGSGAADSTAPQASASIVPAPGSSGAVYPPNPGAIVVFLDPGHGGCLDWGVPNPFENTLDTAEKTMTLRIALALRDRLSDAGVDVVLSRDADEALAGDLEPELECHGPPFRDANGDGQVGFDAEGSTLARDELTARIDLANLARSDLGISIHINSMTENGEVFEIAATQTFYTDETAWGDASLRLAQLVQREVVQGLDGVGGYERQDRGVQAVNYYLIAPPLVDPPPDEPNPRKRPRGLLMPAVLAEVGSISLEAESRLLAAPAGQERVAEALFRAVAEYLAERELAVRLDAEIPGGAAGRIASAVPGDGPPFWATDLPPAGADGRMSVELRVTNTGTRSWPERLGVLAGWQASTEPYLAVPPASLDRLPVELPGLAPGESTLVTVELRRPEDTGRQIVWVTLAGGMGRFSDLGSPPLQLAAPAQRDPG